MIIIASAVEHEVAKIIQEMSHCEALYEGSVYGVRGKIDGHEVGVVFLGMGKDNARENTKKVLNKFKINLFIVCGYGGALVTDIKSADVCVARNYSDESLLVHCQDLKNWKLVQLFTADEIVASPEAREEYAQRTQCGVVDMETEAVAQLLKKEGIPLLSVRVISDTFEEVLPVEALEKAFKAKHTFSTLSVLALHFVKNPKEFIPFALFVRNLFAARRNLTSFIMEFLKIVPKKVIRK